MAHLDASVREGVQVGMGASAAQRQPWDPLPHEPQLWFSRFNVYLKLGVGRTLERAYQDCMAVEGGKGPRPGSAWYAAAREWCWDERAKAWDADRREALLAQEQERRLEGREHRLALIDEFLSAVVCVLAAANLRQIDQEQARAWLPIMRVVFRDLIVEHRRELELFVAERKGEQDKGKGLITIEDLRQAERDLEEWRAATGASGAAAAPAVDCPKPTAGKTLLVCVGPDSALMVDLAALRAVQAATGLKFHRLKDLTRGRFDEYLRRERSKGRPVELVHLAVHASEAGVQFADGVVDGNWLSERLLGVRVMLLAGCEGDGVGDWLGVVPHVITLSEEISHEDAALLTEHFWRGIGLGLDPDRALDAALAKCPPVVAEHVIRHW